MPTNLPVLPLILPLLTAVILLFLTKSPTLRRLIAGISAIMHLVLAGIIFKLSQYFPLLITPMAGFSAPYGITIAIDSLSAVMLLLASIVGLITIFYTIFEKPKEEEHPLRLPLTFFIIAGISLSFITGDLFNMFVAFEIMLISSYALLTLESKEKDIKHSYPYLAINVVGGTLFLCAAALAYALFGSLSFADIAISSTLISTDPRIIVLSVLFVLIFGMKAGFFPMYYWLPKSYPTLPFALGALFSAMLTKVGIYALLRVFGTLMPHSLFGVYAIVLFLSVPTMIFGILGALKRTTIREILCFNLISHIGFMMFAIGLFSEESIAATIFYVIHHVIVIASLFFLAGLIETKTGSGELSKIGNIWQKAPVLSFFFLIQCLSLAGIPPLSGFWGKWMMIREGLTVGADIFVAVLIIASILTVWSLLRILLNGIWNTSPKGEENSSPIISTKNHPLALTTSVIVAISLIIGLNPNPIIKIARQTSANLFNQFEYAEQVLSYQGVRLPEGHVPADTDLLNELNEDSH